MAAVTRAVRHSGRTSLARASTGLAASVTSCTIDTQAGFSVDYTIETEVNGEIIVLVQTGDGQTIVETSDFLLDEETTDDGFTYVSEDELDVTGTHEIVLVLETPDGTQIGRHSCGTHTLGDSSSGGGGGGGGGDDDERTGSSGGLSTSALIGLGAGVVSIGLVFLVLAL